MTPPGSGQVENITRMVDAYDVKHEAAHKRLRDDYRELDLKVSDALKILHAKVERVDDTVVKLANTPVDVTTLVLSPKIVASIVFVIVGIVASMWASTSGLRSDIDKVLTRMEYEQRVTDANAKLLESNNANISKTLEALSKRQELQQLQIGELKESIVILSSQIRK